MSFKNIKKQLAPFLSDVFFETGTYLGDTSIAASEIGFEKIITVELQEYLYDDAKKKCESYSNIEMHLGDSPEIMKRLLPSLEGKITFWLDAHIDGGNYKPGFTPSIRQCPLYEELEIIKTLDRKDHNILIDDMRIIGNVGWGVGTLKEELVKKIKEINPLYTITYLEGEPSGNVPNYNDILVAIIE